VEETFRLTGADSFPRIKLCDLCASSAFFAPKILARKVRQEAQRTQSNGKKLRNGQNVQECDATEAE
jgi:hypothetical protein